MAEGGPQAGDGTISELLRGGAGRSGCLPWVLGLLAVGGGLAVLAYLLLSGSGDTPAQPPGTAGPSPTVVATGSPTPPPAPAQTVTLPEQAGGLELERSGGGQELVYREEVTRDVGIPVESLLTALYADPDGSTAVQFYGGQLTGPVDGSARDAIQALFEANFPNLTAAGPVEQYDAGELGGEVWCATYPDVGSSACGWLDESTVGYVFASGHEAQVAAETLVRMRPDIEVAG